MAQANVSSNDTNFESKGYPVRIFIYDLSQGMASMYSQQLIGKQVDGIWHTSIIVYEKEYFYGGGVQSDNPGQTPYGNPLRKIDMGYTCIPQSVFHEFLNEIAPRFSPSKYDLFKHNCNTFANEAMQFLNGKVIPEYITGLPEEFLNSQVGQMLKPMIDNMQANAMASYGDWGGMGIAAKPHLPPINPKYNKAIMIEDDNNNNNDDDDGNGMKFGGQNVASNKQKVIESNNNKEEKEKGIAVSDKKANDSLLILLDKYHSKHKHKAMDLKVIGNELMPKITNDNKNGQLYVSMIIRNDEMINARQQQGLNEFVKFLDRKRAAKKKGMNIILKLSDDSFEILDELLLMSEPNQLFPIVSLLRLLLIYPVICNRYTKDFMIINQILYKIGIPFENEEEESNDDDISEEKENINDEEMGMNLMDIHLLQFTSIGAVSHLYNGEGEMIKIDDNFINLGLNGLRIKNCNVRLAASRLLFNVIYEIKRQYIFINNDTNDVTKDYSKDINILIKHLQKIIDAVFKYYKKEKHIPTKYRLLCILGLIYYCNDEKLLKQLNINNDKIKQLQNNNNNNVENDDIKNLHHDIITVIA